MSNIGSWALAAASNNATPPDGWPEGQAPSTVNDCAREMMSAIRAQWDDAAWFNFYPTTSPSTYINLDGQNRINILKQSAATTYTATDIYPVGTRLKVINLNTTKYCSVASIGALSTSAVALEVTMDSGTLTSTITSVARSIISPTNTPIPDAAAGGIAWAGVAGTTQAAAVNTGYIIQNAGQTTVTLPAVAAIGDIVAVQGLGAGGWVLTASAGDTIQVGASATSAGGTVTSANQYDAIEVVCVVANTTWATRFVLSSGVTTA